MFGYDLDSVQALSAQMIWLQTASVSAFISLSYYQAKHFWSLCLTTILCRLAPLTPAILFVINLTISLKSWRKNGISPFEHPQYCIACVMGVLCILRPYHQFMPLYQLSPAIVERSRPKHLRQFIRYAYITVVPAYLFTILILFLFGRDYWLGNRHQGTESAHRQRCNTHPMGYSIHRCLGIPSQKRYRSPAR
jgi:hypothetical protein